MRLQLPSRPARSPVAEVRTVLVKYLPDTGRFQLGASTDGSVSREQAINPAGAAGHFEGIRHSWMTQNGVMTNLLDGKRIKNP